MENAICRDAYIRFDTASECWIVGNGLFEHVLDCNGPFGLRHRMLKDKANGSCFIPERNSHLFSVTFNLRVLDGRHFRLIHGQLREGTGELFLILRLACTEAPLEAELTLRVVPGAAGWQQQVSVRTAVSGLVVHGLCPFDYTFDLNGAAQEGVDPDTASEAVSFQEIAYYMKGCKHQGSIAVDRAEIPYEDFRLDCAELGSVFLKSGRRATEEFLPLLFMHSSLDKTGLFAGIQWSGHWFMEARNQLDCTSPRKTVRLSAGPAEFMHTLVPGSPLFSPWGYVGLFRGEAEDAAEVHRRFLERAVIPPKPWVFPPVTYNPWYAFGDRITEDVLKQEAEAAGSLGVDAFIVDAGWYGGSSPEFACNGNFSAGLGDWKADPGKFPSGMKALADYVRARGMKFGLWVEPERVDLRTFEEGEWERDWLAVDEAGQPHEFVLRINKSGWLCFGKAEVREWVKGWLGRLIETYGIDWIKWDSNWWVICQAGHHGHQKGDGEYAHVQGLYEVMEYILKKYPDVTLENCAGGGTRMDTGIMGFSHVQWLDDETELPQRVRCHCSRVSAYMPLHSAYTFAIPAQGEIEDWAEYRSGSMDAFRNRLDYELRSRMMGVWGLGYNLSGLSAAVLSGIARNVTAYRTFGSILQEGRFYNIKPIRHLHRPLLESEANEAYMAVLPSLDRAVLFVFKRRHDGMERLALNGLDSDRTYTVSSPDGEFLGKYPGALLLREGLLPNPEDAFSAIYLLDAVEPIGL